MILETYEQLDKTISERAIDARIRRLARSQGLIAKKSRRLWSYGGPWYFVDPDTNTLVSSEHGMWQGDAYEWITQEEEAA